MRTSHRRCGAACAALICVALAACGSTRPSGLACNLTKYIEAPDKWAPFNLPLDRELNVLSLSAGGEHGAYGAGLLAGWAQAGPAKPIHPRDITVVTGVSTGALIATHAYLGRFDDITKIYTSLSGPQIYKENGLFSLLTSNALTDTSGKDRIISSLVTKELIDAVASEASARPQRKLLVGAVDLDSGEFLKINLTQLAGDTSAPNREKCYEAALGAASAIPVVFSPIFVDGRMLVDGGTRHHAFIQTLDTIYVGVDVKRRLFSIYHGDLRVQKVAVDNGVLPIAKRSSGVVTDQLIKDTAYRLDYIARLSPANRKFDTYFADARAASQLCAPQRALAECRASGSANDEDMFCQPFMKCLAEEGRKEGLRIATQDTWTRDLPREALGSGLSQ